MNIEDKYPDDYPELVDLRKKANRGRASDQFELGEYLENIELPSNPDATWYIENPSHECVVWYRKAADQGLMKAQNKLGWMYLHGEPPVEKDREKGLEWHRRAADQGDLVAQINLAEYHSFGVRPRRWEPANVEGMDHKRAVEWYGKAAKQGDSSSQFWLGWYYQFGHGVESDSNLAVVWFRRAADQGDVVAQYWLGSLYNTLDTDEDIESDIEQAMFWLRKAAKQGHSEALFDLAMDDWKFFSTDESDSSVKLLEEASSHEGCVDAEYELTESYFRRSMHRQKMEDLKENAGLYKRAAEQGHADAQRDYGLYCLLERPLEFANQGLLSDEEIDDIVGTQVDWSKQDYEEEAFKWLERAAEQGDLTATFMLGECYDRGIGVEKDSEAAECYWDEDLTYEDTVAQLNIASYYDDFQNDSKIAAKWITKALDGSKTRACRPTAPFAMYQLGRFYEYLLDWYSDWPVILLNELEAVERKGRGTNWHLEEAAIWFEKAAHEGHVGARLALANCYRSGNGVEKNREQYEVWLRRAALSGERPQDLAALGRSYGERDAEEGLKWIFKALDLEVLFSRRWKDIYKDVDALLERSSAAVKYSHAHWCDENLMGSAAAYWLKRAAEEGHADAQFESQRRLLDSNDGVIDPAKAFQWFLEASDEGHARAQMTMAEHYRDGLRVLQNEMVAYVFANLATMNANREERDDFAMIRDELSSRLTARKRLEAQAIAGKVAAGEKLRDLLPI